MFWLIEDQASPLEVKITSDITSLFWLKNTILWFEKKPYLKLDTSSGFVFKKTFNGFILFSDFDMKKPPIFDYTIDTHIY